MNDADTPESALALEEIRAGLREAVSSKQGLSLVGGGTKAFLRPPSQSPVLSLTAYRGIVDYAPAELVAVVRAGTPLQTLTDALAGEGQQLAFEPPHTGAASTVGGVISAGFSGPARPYTAAVRDHVLGIKLLAVTGEVLRFGGRVMKNVAGYDVSRLVVGAWGAFGPVLEVALRVVPKPAVERCLCCALPSAEAWPWVARSLSRHWPITGLCYDGTQLHLRLAGSAAAVESACRALGAQLGEESPEFWARLRDWQLPFFADPRPLWRVVLPLAAPDPGLSGLTLTDWGGAQRWLKTDAPPDEIRTRVAAAGGNAWPFDRRFATRSRDLQPARLQLEARLRHSFDPDGIFNPELAMEEG